MKRIAGLVAALIIGHFSAQSAYAREGTIQISNSDIACEGVSVWRENSYRITGRCQGLVYPYETLYDHYVLWAQQDNGTAVRVDDIDRGYFEGATSNPFANIYITAEGTSSPRRPSDKQILAGSVKPFSFDTSTTTTPVASATPTPRPAGTTQESGSTSGTTVGSVMGRILRALLLIVFVIIIVAIVASLIFRRRGSVSA